jgi:hypothetical protein
VRPAANMSNAQDDGARRAPGPAISQGVHWHDFATVAESEVELALALSPLIDEPSGWNGAKPTECVDYARHAET